MKKSIIALCSVLCLALVAAVGCGPALTPPPTLSSPALTLYSVSTGGIAEVTSGTQSLRNVSFVITGKASLKLDRAPDGAQCSYVNGQSQIYCRLPDLLPGTKSTALYTGIAGSGKLAYIGTPGTVVVVDATLK